MSSAAPTRAEVDLRAIRENVEVLRARASGASLWPVVKANAYGHGMLAVVRALAGLPRGTVGGFCVARLDEAIDLRNAGVQTPVLVLGGCDRVGYGEVIHHGLLPVLHHLGQLELLDRAARAARRRVSAHLKIDTGMSRLGIGERDLPRVMPAVRAAPAVDITGIMTHLACADAEPSAPEAGETTRQLARFEQATRTLEAAGLPSGLTRHAANSAALLRGQGLFDLVRPGLAIYGVAPVDAPGMRLSPALRVRSEVVDLRTIESGATVGYGARFKAKRSTRVATVGMGYADGLSRRLSNRGSMLVGGRRAPIIGSVSMGMTALDVTDVGGVELGSEAVLLGSQQGSAGAGHISAAEIAEAVESIPWEVLTSIASSVPRVYLD